MTLNDFTFFAKDRVNQLLNEYIKPQNQSVKLQEVLAYSGLNCGKRIRPLLVYLAGYIFNGSRENLDAAAVAIELIHIYSLIHDDLPAMDNSDLRRGLPTCHKIFGEALAILAGDALQPLAFEALSTHPSALTDSQRLKMIQALAKDSGANGMAAGQTLDIEGVKTLKDLTTMYHLKTGALLQCSVELGAIAANVDDKDIIESLRLFAKNLGLAFQIQDDLLDLESSSKTGKPQGIDQQNAKFTFPALIGVQKSHEHVQKHFTVALAAIDFLGERASLLREFAETLLSRTQ